MALEVKICGVNTPETAAAVSKAGAQLAGLVFYPKSPRALTPAQAAQVAAAIAPGIAKVGLFVDPADAQLEAVLKAVPLDLLQLHGEETPQRLAAIKARFELPVMKVLKMARAADLDQVKAYAGVADRFLFDARPPKDRKDALPGGNAVAFDWRILAGKRFPKPWMLAGGLKPENLRQAVEISGATAVDASSGVESSPGVKDPEKIRAFLAAARAL
ncbi:MAG: phosphoribosylanthranilate isomerase [Rhodovibrionaceae bacterium]